MKDQHKHTLFLSIVAATAFILGWGVWTNYRPTIVYAGCGDIAGKTSNISTRTTLPGEFDYDTLFYECIKEATAPDKR